MAVEIQHENSNKSCDTENGEAIECGRKVNIGQPYELASGLASMMPIRRHTSNKCLGSCSAEERNEETETLQCIDDNISTSPVRTATNDASKGRQHEARPSPPPSSPQTPCPPTKQTWRKPLRRDHDFGARYIYLSIFVPPEPKEFVLNSLFRRMLGVLGQRSSGMPATGAVVEGLYGCAGTSPPGPLGRCERLRVKGDGSEGAMLTLCWVGWNRGCRRGRRIRSITT